MDTEAVIPSLFCISCAQHAEIAVFKAGHGVRRACIPGFEFAD